MEDDVANRWPLMSVPFKMTSALPLQIKLALASGG
jgi:hypothetical protein